MAGERPDWEWYERASGEVAAGNLDAAEDTVAAALGAGHLWRVSLLMSPALESLRRRRRFEEVAAEARRRVDALQLKPVVLTAMPQRSGLAPLVLVLHGATGNGATELERWRPATEQGFIVVAAQSSQPATADGFCWDGPRDRILQDLRAIAALLPPHARVILAGFSQGAWVALNLALEAELVVSGAVVMVAPFAAVGQDLRPAWRRLKVSVLIGENDPYRPRVERLVDHLLRREHHVFLDVIEGLGHQYPPDFAERLPGLLRP